MRRGRRFGTAKTLMVSLLSTSTRAPWAAPRRSRRPTTRATAPMGRSAWLSSSPSLGLAAAEYFLLLDNDRYPSPVGRQGGLCDRRRPRPGPFALHQAGQGRRRHRRDRRLWIGERAQRLSPVAAGGPRRNGQPRRG